jgi:hypothetical protein
LNGENEKSLREVEKISTPCPHCGIPIQKIYGCDHMTCQWPCSFTNPTLTLTHITGKICSHEFCWTCSADYDDIRREGNHRHEKSCRYYTALPTGTGQRRANRTEMARRYPVLYAALGMEDEDDVDDEDDEDEIEL